MLHIKQVYNLVSDIPKIIVNDFLIIFSKTFDTQ